MNAFPIVRVIPVRARQRGISLIELMVAMAIGLVITIVIAQIFINSKSAFSADDALSRLQENARYSLTALTRAVRFAGYRSNPNVSAVSVFPSTAPALAGTEGTGIVADSITVRFQGSGDGAGTTDGTVQDCSGVQKGSVAGTGLDSNQIAVNTFYIANDPQNNSEPTLYCNFATPTLAASPLTPCDTAGLVPGTTCNSMPLVPGVENMQILYGEDTDNPKDQSANRFLTANNVTSMDNVVSVRISILLRTAIGINTGVSAATYNMSGTTVGSFNDTRMRRVFTTVINLRTRTL
jgi:type IV pilus assembly protein PilW